MGGMRSRRVDVRGESAAAARVTIVTVCVQKHYDLIRQSVALIRDLNPGFSYKILVVDNSSTERPGLFLDDPACEVIAGSPRDETKPSNCRNSYHHGAALNSALRWVTTPFLLVIDPDLFVVRPDWLSEMVEHMERRELAFFGVPWHPRWYNKYRDFPCVHLQLIDLRRVDPQELDFLPDIVNARDWSRGLAVDRFSASPGRRAFQALAAAVYQAFYPLAVRHRINCARDTGYWTWARFGLQAKAEVVSPVVDFPRHFVKPAHLARRWGMVLERTVPQRISFFPRPGSYVERKDVPSFEVAELEAMDPEMFVWRGAPFAFHIRGNIRSADAHAVSDSATRPLSDALQHFRQTPYGVRLNNLPMQTS